MKKWIPWIIVAIIAVGLYSWGKGFNNTAVEYEADAKKILGCFQQAE